jgi:dihydrofolate reductase
MSKLLVRSFAVSLDGFGAGANQSLENPLGERGPELMEWFFHSQFWNRMHGKDGGETGVDNSIAEHGFDNLGAWILGRNMFGRCAGHGRTKAGKAGGATSRRTTCPCSCSRTMRARRSR